MTWWVALSGGIGLLLGLLFLGIPVFVAFLILNVAGILVLMGPAGFGLFANSIYTTATTTALATVPLFIVMGEILFRSGAMEAVFDSLDRLVGRIRGRQYILCILLSAILGALSGAAMAVAGLLGRSLFPEMRRRGYNTRLSAGTILAGACLDPIIPPSVLAILIATLAEISTAGLLIAGIIPGLLLMCLFLIYVMYRVWRDPSLAPDVASDMDDAKPKTSAIGRRPSHASLRLRVLHGHGADHVRRRDADRSGRDRRVRRDHRRHHLPQVFRGRCWCSRSPRPRRCRRCCWSSCAAP